MTSGVRVLTKGTSRQMIPCDHEEADTRLLVHVIDSLNAGCSTCLVRTVDKMLSLSSLASFIIYIH